MSINVKTEYSYSQSIVRINELVKFALTNNITALAVADYNSTRAFFQLNSQCLSNNIKPIFGVELSVTHQEGVFSLLLYAKNNRGYVRINQLVSEFNQFGKVELITHEPDLIAVTPGEYGYIEQAFSEQQAEDNENNIVKKRLEQYQTLFDNFYFGISNFSTKTSLQMFEFAQKNQIKCINNQPVFFIEEAEYEQYALVKAIEKEQAFTKARDAFRKHAHYSFEHSLKIDKLANIADFATTISTEIETQTRPIIEFKLAKEVASNTEYLRELANYGLKRRLNGQVTPNYQERLNYELEVIEKMGYTNYFLIVWDIVKYAKQHDVYVGPGRGSAAGSLVAYAIGITEIDSVKYGLFFERFLNPMRISMPDIDLDFEDSKRDEIVEYLVNKYGQERVMRIITNQRFQTKSAIKATLKAFNVATTKIDFITKKIDSTLNFKQNLQKQKELNNLFVKEQELALCYDYIIKLEGQIKHESIHAAGIVISNNDVNNYCSTKNGISAYTMEELETIGLIKFDLLALTNLSIMHEVINKLPIEKQQFKLSNIPLDCPKVYQLLASAKTSGIFQMESAGIRNLLQKYEPKEFADVALILSLYRPGPMSEIDNFIKVKNNLITAAKYTKVIDEILKPTSGIIIYQEQIMEIARKFANFSYGEADLIRRAISKKDEEKLTETRELFISKALENNQNLVIAEKVFELILKFADYGFNKAHAYSYATIVYQMAYLKAHYPAEFYAVMFERYTTTTKKNEFYLELQADEFKLLPPSLWHSAYSLVKQGNNLLIGLSMINGVRNEVAKEIIELREQTKITQTLKINEIIELLFIHTAITVQEFQQLIYAGVFDFAQVPKKAFIELLNREKELSNDASVFITKKRVKISTEEFSFTELASYEQKALSINIKYHLFNEISKLVNKVNLTTIERINQYEKVNRNRNFLVLAKLQKVREINTKKDQKMAFLEVLSEFNNYDITVFPEVYEHYFKELKAGQGNYFVFEIVLRERGFALEKLELIKLPF
ncbi:MAG: DNA polymerase III subunit alpha [Mycoplasmatales bacterium]